jgi:hypothetical protein
MAFGLAMDNGQQEILRFRSFVCGGVLHWDLAGLGQVVHLLLNGWPGRSGSRVSTRLNAVHEEYHMVQDGGMG